MFCLPFFFCNICLINNRKRLFDIVLMHHELTQEKFYTKVDDFDICANLFIYTVCIVSVV